MNGKIKFFNESKGFGFIKGEDGKDYFMHVSQIPENMNTDEGVEVIFDVKTTEKGVQAIKVAYAD